MTVQAEMAWYVYAVVPGELLPPDCCETIVPGAGLSLVVGDTKSQMPPLAALVSLVPKALFDSHHPSSRAAEPSWVAARAAAHHAIIATICMLGPCVPLSFGTLFASTDSVKAWLTAKETCLRTAVAKVSGCDEFAATLLEDVNAHSVWLTHNSDSLLQLRRDMEAAGPGVAFLLARRFEKLLAAMRTSRCARLSSEIGERFEEVADAINEVPPHGAVASWSLLIRRDISPDFLETVNAGLAATGLSLRITGPWPPYAFARAAWKGAHNE